MVRSTLLKLIAVTQPTEGTVEVAGKLSALLELGWAFIPTLPAAKTC